MARRAYVGDFTFRLGAIVTRGKLMSIRNSESDKATKLHYISPDGLPVAQVYRCANGNVYLREDLGKAKLDEDGNLIPVDADAVADAKTSALPLNSIDLNVHKTSEIDNFLFPDKSQAYIFVPWIKNSSGKKVDDPVNDKWAEILNSVVRNPNVALVGRCNLNNHEGMFRLSTYKGHIVLQKQLYPEEVNHFDELDIALTSTEQAKVDRLVDALVKPFNAEDYPNEITQRVIQATSADFDPSTLAEAKEKDNEVDVLSALDAALAEFA
jgi:non-homologous end joining protein Ku